jgi:hypothetical protein
MVDNLQTRQLAGLTDPKLPCTAAVLDQAAANLRDHYGIVATTDGFDSLLKVLIALFHWPDVAYSDQQVGSPEPPDENLRARTAVAVERYFAYDRELYAQVLARPTPWRTGLFEGAAGGCRRQDQVLFRLNERVALMPVHAFDEAIRPMLRRSGIDLKFA